MWYIIIIYDTKINLIKKKLYFYFYSNYNYILFQLRDVFPYLSENNNNYTNV